MCKCGGMLLLLLLLLLLLPAPPERGLILPLYLTRKFFIKHCSHRHSALVKWAGVQHQYLFCQSIDRIKTLSSVGLSL